MKILKKIKIKHVFIVYIICLTNFVVVKFFGNTASIKDRIQSTITQRNNGYWNIELTPFRSIISSINSYLRHSQFGTPSTYLLVANIIIFIPLGFLLPFLMRKPSFLKTIGISLAVILCFEIIQFITCLGVLDLDDIILNGIGSAIGYLPFMIYTKLKKTVDNELNVKNP